MTWLKSGYHEVSPLSTLDYEIIMSFTSGNGIQAGLPGLNIQADSLHGCTQLPAVVGILRSQSGRRGSRPVARLASCRSPELYSDDADRRRHLRHRARRP
jgi:hypothetical protein